MRAYLIPPFAALLFAIAGPDCASAQTLMDYFVSRESMSSGECVTPPAVNCAAPIDCYSSWQPTTACTAPVVPSTYTGCAAVPTSTCVAPQACRPRYEYAECTSVPNCAVPSTPSRGQIAPSSSCRCHRADCRCRNGSECEEDSKCCRCCCCCSEWSRAHTTGDMYPHYPYPPEHGGYYYFRPYNYENVYEHIARAAEWNLHPGNPYSVSLFDVINEEFEQRYPRSQIMIPAPPRTRDSGLPTLESLLRPVP